MPTLKRKKREVFKGDIIHIRVAQDDKSLIEQAADSVGLQSVPSCSSIL